MDDSLLFLLLSFLLTFTYALAATFSGRKSQLPPGPYPFPIIGNLLKLSDQPHKSVAILSRRYGPLMSLKLGSRTTIVVSSSDIAKKFFHTHDISFSSRTIPGTARLVNHHTHSMVWLPIGDMWRTQQRITKEYMFSIQRLGASEPLRRQKVQELVDHVNECCTNKRAVNIGGAAFKTVVNILSNFIFSMDLAQLDPGSSREFQEAISTLMEFGGKQNYSDLFPILRPLDPQGLFARANGCFEKLLTILNTIVDQRLQTKSSTKNDVLDSLLDIIRKNESEFSRDDMIHLFMVFFLAGTDTTSGTFEWAMTEFICNPKKMEVARSEIIKLVEKNGRNIQEEDISQLPYLQAVIKETLRLHPPAPFLVPHQATHDVEVEGFVVPKNAQILCNVWAIGRDPKVWSNPEEFMPERFLDVKIDYKGQDFEFIPFGAGRRICPGMNIAHRMLHMMLVSFIHKFDWKLEENVSMDMEEKFGLTLQRNVPLMVIPIKL